MRKRSDFGPLSINRTLTLTTPWRRSTLLHQSGSTLADFFERPFEATKLLRTQFREHSRHLPGMFSEGGNNESLAPRGEGDNPNAPVYSALDSADQAFREETVDSDTDRAIEERKQAEFYLADGQRIAHTGSWAFTPAGFEYWSAEVLRPPDVLGRFRYLMAWHPRMNTDASHVWLRKVIRGAGKGLLAG